MKISKFIFIVVGILSPLVSSADSYSRGPTIRQAFLAQDSKLVTAEKVVSLQKAGYLLLINSIKNGAGKKFIRLGKIEMDAFGEDLKKFDESVEVKSGQSPISKGTNLEHSATIHFEVITISRDEAKCRGSWFFSNYDDQNADKCYDIIYRINNDGEWVIVSIGEGSFKNE